MESVIHALRETGWKVTWCERATRGVPDALLKRYAHLSSDICWLVSRLHECMNQTETVWLVCSGVYEEASESAFAWNEWEKISLDACVSIEERISVTSFWDAHIPIAVSLNSGYDYAAVRVKGEGAGFVFHGCEPDFECVSFLASSIEDFLSKLLEAAREKHNEFPIRLFV